MAIQDHVVSTLEEKVEQVIRVAEKLNAANVQLQQQMDELKEQLCVKNREMEVLESKYQSLKFAKSMFSFREDAGDAKQQVNRMVREIDRCIALLNK